MTSFISDKTLFLFALFILLPTGLFAQAERNPGEFQNQDRRILRQAVYGRTTIFPGGTQLIEKDAGDADLTKHPRFSFTQTLPPVISEGEFEAVAGPPGGSVRSIVSDGKGSIFAATDGGVYRSTDDGAHWDSHAFPSFVFNFVEPVTILAPGVIVAETDFINFLSRDNGVSWSYLFEDVLGFAVDANGDIYAGSRYNGGVKRSTDTAKSWNNFALSGKRIWNVLLAGEGKLVCASDSGFYYSSDSGATWTFSSYQNTDTGTQMVCDATGRLFVCSYQKVLRSDDFGRSWTTLINLPETIYRLYVGKDSRVYVVTYSRVISSSDGGVTWNDLNFHLGNVPTWYGWASPLTVGWNDVGEILVGTFYGVLRFDSTLQRWKETSTGMHASRIDEIAVTPPGSILAVSLGYCYRSADAGHTWSRLVFDSTVHVSGLPMFSASSGYAFILATSTNFTGPHMMRSTDDGVSWQKNYVAFNNDQAAAIGEMPSGDLLVATRKGNIYRSSDGGGSWRWVYSDPKQSSMRAIAADAGGTIYAAVDSAVLVSRNGIRFDRIPLARSTFYEKESIVIGKGEDVFLATHIAVFHSSDKGRSWAKVTKGLSNPNPFVLSAAADKTGNVFLGDYGLFRINNRVDGWERYGAGSLATFVMSLCVSVNGYLFAGTQSFGLYKSEHPVERFDDARISGFRLATNYPNPFNGGTKIGYELRFAGFVEIKIYNSLGQLITTLASEDQSAGAHVATWLPERVAAGVYFCRMTATISSQKYWQVLKLVYVK